MTLGAASVVVVGLCSFIPSLLHGTYLGPYDLLSQFGLGRIPGITPHNLLTSDQIEQFVPWSLLQSSQVHAGHVPLWNPYSAMGLPLAFDFQSGSFGLPALLGYLGPASFAFTISILAKCAIAGTGAFFLCRKLGLGAAAATFAGISFELSGAFAGWLGWSLTGASCWLGWLLGGALVLTRTSRPLRAAAFFSIVMACAAYGGHPETLGICLVATFGVAVITLGLRGLAGRTLVPLKRIGVLALATAGGFALAAPLLLPGAQLVVHAAKYNNSGYEVLPRRIGENFLFAGFSGYPTSSSLYFGYSNYYETAAWVGFLVVVLALFALLHRWRRPEIAALSLVALVFFLVIFTVPGARVVNSLPFTRPIVWTRGLVVIDFCLIVLASCGFQALLEHRFSTGAWTKLAASVGVGILAFVLVRTSSDAHHLLAGEAAIRNRSFLWPGVSLVVLSFCVIVLFWFRYRRAAPRAIPPRAPFVAVAAVLLGAQTAFALTATPDLWSSSPHGFVATKAEQELQRLVGTSRIGFASCPALDANPGNLGILPESNSAYGVSEVSAYDPILPKALVSAWSQVTHTTAPPTFGTFCPSIDNASDARLFGASYVLSPSGAPAPSDTEFVARIDGETLYRVARSGVLTLGSTNPLAGGEPVPFSTNGDGVLQCTVDLKTPETLDAHLTAVPGWTGSIDGRPLSLRSWRGFLLSAVIPPGHHRIVLRYWPTAFSIGIAASVVTVVIYLGLAIILLTVKRRSVRRAATS